MNSPECCFLCQRRLQDVCHAVMIQCTVCSTRISRGRMAAHIETHRCSNCHQLVEHSEERCPMVWCQAHQRRQPCADCEKVPCPICQVKQANQAACDAHQEERHRCPKCEGLFPNAAEHQQQAGVFACMAAPPSLRCTERPVHVVKLENLTMLLPRQLACLTFLLNIDRNARSEM